MTQLTLDVFAPDRRRAGRHTPESHQRGWVAAPYNLADGRPAGTVMTAWVCCRCGGVEPNEYHLERNHGCCDRNVVNHPCDRRGLPSWPGWALAWDANWTPHDPREAA